MLILSFVLLPVLGAAGVVALGKNHWKIRNEFFRIMTFVSLAFSAFFLACAFQGREFTAAFEGAVGLGLHFKADGFRSMYAFLASFMWAMTALMSERYFRNYHNRTRYYFFSLMTLAGTLGVFMSDDLYTTFVFFEIMSICSYAWVAHDETEGAMRAAATYLGVAVLGGMVTLMGMFMMYKEIGSLSFAAIHEAKGMNLHLSSALILFGFIAKAGAVPVQIWLPKAHPVAPAPASALLSGMLTKTGLFGVLVIAMNLYSGSYVFGCITLALALVTMLLGAVLGVFSTNLKRTLACSSMSQIGYILTGVGASVLLGSHGSLPAAGAVMHMVNHSVLKLVLFMSAGVVYMNLHRLELNDIRGFGRKKPFLNVVFLLGALGLMGIPGTSGYASKTLIHEGLVEWVVHTENMFIFRFSEWVFLFAAGLTTAYMLKLYVAIFIQKNPDEKRQADFDNMGKKYLDVRTRIALTLSAVWIVVLGVLPNGVFMKAYTLSEHFLHQHALHEIHFFSWVNLKG
ncbi:MAG: sodium:proton antiporter, partial [Clostridia bacterium]|nr:sodium:proton antiporter [Clostridia bacterium]